MRKVIIHNHVAARDSVLTQAGTRLWKSGGRYTPASATEQGVRKWAAENGLSASETEEVVSGWRQAKANS